MLIPETRVPDPRSQGPTWPNTAPAEEQHVRGGMGSLLQVCEVGADASWRRERLTHWDVINRMYMQGKTPSPLFNAPWVTKDIFRRDWLHASDLGVAADFAGNALKLLQTKFAGANKKDRTQALFGNICEWYERNHIPASNRLQLLTTGMIQASKKSPKLRANAGIVRKLVPYLEEATRLRLNAADPLEGAVVQAAHHLNECYAALSNDCIFHASLMQRNSRLFALQYVALAQAHDGRRDWVLKPKMHTWLELNSEHSRPALFWTYRDEDYVGGVSRMARRRGGDHSVPALSRQVLESFRVKQPIVRIM